MSGLYAIAKQTKATDKPTSWQPPETVPKDRIVLLKTAIGIVSGQWFAGEWDRNYFEGDEYRSPVLSCYEDAITIECDYETTEERPRGKEVFPELLAWMEIPR